MSVELLNSTSFAADRAVFWDRTGAEQLVLVLKGTWSLGEDGSLSLKEEQVPVSPVDEFRDDPETSSISQEAELGPVKPATDVFLTGSAKAPRAGTRIMDVRLKIGSLGRTVRVFGPRRWGSRLGMARISEPEPFDTVPLIWENAFGGKDLSAGNEKHHSWQPDNPVGRGYRSRRSKLDWKDTLLPCIEDPRDLLDRPDAKPRPAGFGPIGRNWQPRVAYAGTYDQDWMDNRMPFLPDDFDDRFHNAAPPGLVAAGYLEGGQTVEVTGCTRGHKLAVRLPRLQAHGLVLVKDEPLAVELPLNTVTIDTDSMELRLLWKGAVRVHGLVNHIQLVEWSSEGELP